MQQNERKGEITSLRTKIKESSILRIELLAAVIGVLRNHNIALDESIVTDLVIAIPEEITNEMMGVVLPGGTGQSGCIKQVN